MNSNLDKEILVAKLTDERDALRAKFTEAKDDIRRLEMAWTMDKAHVVEAEAQNARLVEALKIGIAEVILWLQSGECDCSMDGGSHTCGAPERRRNLGKMQAALADVAKGEAS